MDWWLWYTGIKVPAHLFSYSTYFKARFSHVRKPLLSATSVAVNSVLFLLLNSRAPHVFHISNGLGERKASCPKVFLHSDGFQPSSLPGEASVYPQPVSTDWQIPMSHIKPFNLPSAYFFLVAYIFGCHLIYHQNHQGNLLKAKTVTLLRFWIWIS